MSLSRDRTSSPAPGDSTHQPQQRTHQKQPQPSPRPSAVQGIPTVHTTAHIIHFEPSAVEMRDYQGGLISAQTCSSIADSEMWTSRRGGVGKRRAAAVGRGDTHNFTNTATHATSVTRSSSSYIRPKSHFPLTYALGHSGNPVGTRNGDACERRGESIRFTEAMTKTRSQRSQLSQSESRSFVSEGATAATDKGPSPHTRTTYQYWRADDDDNEDKGQGEDDQSESQAARASEEFSPSVFPFKSTSPSAPPSTFAHGSPCGTTSGIASGSERFPRSGSPPPGSSRTMTSSEMGTGASAGSLKQIQENAEERHETDTGSVVPPGMDDLETARSHWEEAVHRDLGQWEQRPIKTSRQYAQDCGQSQGIGRSAGQGQVRDRPKSPTVAETNSAEITLGHEIIAAVNVKGRTTGCAYYDGHLAKLFVMQDLIDSSAVDMIHILKAQLRPTLILANVRLDETVIEALRFDETGQETKIEVRPSGDFSYAVAKSKLISVYLSAHRAERESHSSGSRDGGGRSGETPTYSMDDASQREAQIHLSSAIDLQSVESVGCAGALVSFVSRHGLSQHVARPRGYGGGATRPPLMILAIESFSIKTFVFINPNSLASLQVFEDETHPSMHSSIRGRKEGLSLYGILNQTKTPQGRYLLKQWLLRPSLDLNVVHARHQSVECFMRIENQQTVQQLAAWMAKVKNIPKVIQTLPRKATLTEWQAILQFAYYCLKIYSGAQEILVGESPVLGKILLKFVTQDLMDVGSFINDALDFDESVIEGRCVVKHSVDEELDRMRATYHGLDNFLSEVAKDISHTIPSDFTSTINVIYFPQLGYLITVPMNPNWTTDQDFYLEGLTYQFCTESTVYYKNNAMRDLDDHLGDIHGLIVDREIDIMQGLQERILEYSPLLIACSDLCAELDVLVSFAQVARLRNYRRPIMTEDNILHIIGGRHALQELVVDSFVANDTQMGEIQCVSLTRGATSSSNMTYTKMRNQCADVDTEMQTESEGEFSNNRVMILSGANSSGKSVYLKQVALITYMAHIGCFVPANSAVIGLTDKILTRLQTRETVSCIQSAFMKDLQQVNLALRFATRRSLVVLDEFGKGTTPNDGAGLFCGVLEHFARIPAHERPKVLATTHFHELFENELLDFTIPISLCTMEVYTEANSLEATFLFRVIPGKTPSSLGPVCAAMAEMPAHIVQRGIELSNMFRQYERVIPMLTEYEISKQRMHEQLTAMLLQLDLDQDMDFELLEDKDQELSIMGSLLGDVEGGEEADETVKSTGDEGHLGSGTTTKKVTCASVDGGNASSKATAGHRKRYRNKGDHESAEGDKEMTRRMTVLKKAMDELMQYAALVEEKESEEE